MKKIFLLAATTTMLACGESPKNSFTVQGAIEGLDSMVTIEYFNGKESIVLDSTMVASGGTFELEGMVEMPVYGTISDAGGRRIAPIFIENTEFTLTGKISAMDSIKLTGGTLGAIYDSVGVALKGVKTVEEYVAKIEQAVLRNTNNVAGAYILYRQLAPYIGLEKLIEIADKFDPALNNSIYVKIIKEKIETLKKSAVGMPFTDFSAPNTKGEMVALSSIAGKGQWVLLDFWAAWCGPCRAENPHVVEAYNKYNGKGFTVVGYSLDRDKKDWLDAIEKDKLPWTNLSDLEFWQSAPSKAYGVTSIPANVLINPEGVIVAKDLRGEALLEFLSQNIK